MQALGTFSEEALQPPHLWPVASSWSREQRKAAATLLVHMLDMVHTHESSALCLGARRGVYVARRV